jgi:hypothetical protein
MNIVIGSLVLLMSVFYTFLLKLRLKKYDLVSWFILSYGIMIGFGLIVTSIYYQDNVRTGELIYQFSRVYDTDAVEYIPITFVFLFSVCVGALAASRFRFSGFSYFLAKIQMENCSEQYVLKRYYLTALVLFFLSFFCYGLYVSAYGGFIEYLAFSAAVRSGVMDSLPNNPFSFLIAFGGLSFLSSYLYFALFRVKKSFFTFLMLVASISFSVYVLFSWLGRISFLFYFMVFFMSFSLNKDNLKPRLKILFIFFSIFFIMLYLINSLLDRGSYDGVFQMLSMELIFPIVSLLNALEKFENFRFGIDLVNLPIFWTPQRFWADFVLSSDAVNTHLIFGSYKGQSGNTGAVPSDILTLSYFNFGYFGFIIFGFFTGFILKLLDSMSLCIKIREIRVVLYAFMIMNLSVLTSIYADPSHIAGRLFPFVSFILVFWASKFCFKAQYITRGVK